MVEHKRNSVGRLLLPVSHMMGVFANPTADNPDSGETTVTGQTPSGDGNVLTTDSPTESETCEDINTSSRSSPDTVISEHVMEKALVKYNDTKQDTAKDPISINTNDERLYDQDTIIQTFGGPGPPITKLMDDLDELTLDSLESSQSSSIDREKYDYTNDTIDPYQSRKVDCKTDIVSNPTPLPNAHSDGSRGVPSMSTLSHSGGPHGVPSMSTLSQDDMTLDAEMGRPPRINAAGRPIRRQHDERDRPEQPVRQPGQQQAEQHVLRDIKHVALEDSPDSNTSARRPAQRLHEEHGISVDDERYAQPRHNVEKYVDRDTTEHKHERHGQSRRYDEKDLMEFIRQLAKDNNKPAPTVKLFDAAILYDKNDYDDVKRFKDVVNMIATKELQEDLRIELFDSEEFVQSKVLVVGDVVERCSVVFIYLTDNSDTEFFNLFCDEAVGMARLGLQTGLDMKDRKWMLKPVHTQPFKSRRYKIPIGLLTVVGVEWYDWPQTYVRDKVKAILKIAILRRKKMETEKNILLSYGHAFSKEDGQIVSNQRASSFGQSQIPLNTRAHSESVDAYSFNPPYPTIPPDFGYPRTLDKHHGQYLARQPQQPPAYATPPMNVPYPSMPPPSYQPYQQQQYQHPNVSQYCVNQSFQYNPNLYQGQMYALPQHTGMRYTHNNYGHVQMAQAPPPYQQTIMQDQLSHAYPYTSPHFIGPHGYPVSHMTPIQQIPQPAIDTRQNIADTRPDERGTKVVLGQHTTQSGHKPPLNHTDPVGQNGAAFGSLMRDKRDDTPASHELTVVSRLDGRLITNPNLSNDDLEIDTGIKHGKDQSTTDGEGKLEVTSDSSDDSCDSDVDGDHDVNIGKLFRGQGKVVNIIGSSVVQLGKNNKAVEHYQTKKVYQATKKESRDNKTNAKVLESEQSHAKRHNGPEYASKFDNDDGPQINDGLTFRDGRYTSRDCVNSRTENIQDRRYNMLRDQSIKPDLSKDEMSYTEPNLDDRAYRDTQNHVIGIQTQTHTITTRDLLNNLDQGESVSSNRRDEASDLLQRVDRVSGPTNADFQQISQVPIFQTEDSRQRSIDSRQINKTYNHNPDMDLRQISRLPKFLGDNSRPYISNRIEYITSSQDDNVDDERQVSIDDNTSVPITLDPVYDDREDELFGTGTSDIQEHGQAKFLFSSFRSSVFSKPSSMCSDVNVEQVCDEKHDSVD